MNKMNKIYLIITVFCVILVGIGIYYVNTNMDKLKLKQEVFVIEYGEKISSDAKDYVNAEKSILKKAKVVVKYEMRKDLEYPVIGTYDGTVSYEKEKHTFKVKVKDTIAPKFLDFKKEIKVEQNAEEVDFVKYFNADDLSEVKITVDDKKVDLAKIGEYEVEVTATDAYDNKTTEKTKVIVVGSDKADEVTETVDGEKPLSAETKKEKEEQAQQQQQQQQQSTGTNSGGTSGGSSTGGNTSSGGGQTSQPSQPSQPAEPVYRPDLANDCMAKINAWRVQNGVHELKYDGFLQGIADQRAMELITDFSHNGAQTAENIAMCYGYDGAYQDFFTSWKNSPGHNQNQLSPNYLTFAVSIINYKGEWFGVTVFLDIMYE